jgi:hypothetical protein
MNRLLWMRYLSMTCTCISILRRTTTTTTTTTGARKTMTTCRPLPLLPIQLALQADPHADPYATIIKAKIDIGPFLQLSREGGVHVHLGLVEWEH